MPHRHGRVIDRSEAALERLSGDLKRIGETDGIHDQAESSF
jgi:hypothetical protein